MAVQMVDVRKLTDKAAPDQFFERHLGKPVDVHRVSGYEETESLDLLRGTLGIYAKQRLRVIHRPDLGSAAADGTGSRDLQRI